MFIRKENCFPAATNRTCANVLFYIIDILFVAHMFSYSRHSVGTFFNVAETSSSHGGVAVGLKLDEREAAIARLVPHVRVHDDVTDALDELAHLGEDLWTLALTRQDANEKLVVVDRQGDAESPPGTDLEPVMSE